MCTHLTYFFHNFLYSLFLKIYVLAAAPDIVYYTFSWRFLHVIIYLYNFSSYYYYSFTKVPGFLYFYIYYYLLHYSFLKCSMLPIVFVGEFLFSLHPFLYFLYVLYLLISLNLLSSLQLQTFPTPFPAFPRQTPLFIQKPSPIKVNPSKYPPFLPQNPPKPYFLSPKTPKNPPFSLKKPPKPLFFPIFHTFSSKIQDFRAI